MASTFNFLIAPAYFSVLSIILFLLVKKVKLNDRMARTWWSEDYWKTKPPANRFPSVVKQDAARTFFYVIPLWTWTIIGIFTQYALLHWLRIVIGTFVAVKYDKEIEHNTVAFSRTYYAMALGMFLTILLDQLQIISLPTWAKYQF